MNKLLTGNEAIARGAWEAGVQYATAYPGTPSTEILENLSTYSDVISEWAPNEKTAMESAAGASFTGIRTLCAMKHVGMNVASDPMLSFAYIGVNGGCVVVTADEPGMHSSQNEQDNRHYARLAKMPMLEPSDSQEAKDMVATAFEISETYDVPVIIRLTTRVCHSKSIVKCQERQAVVNRPYVKNTMGRTVVPAAAKVNQQKLIKNMKALSQTVDDSKWNYIEDNHAKIGVIGSGVAYYYGKEVFGKNASYLKVGFSYPMPMNLIKTFADKVETLYILEENDPIMEKEIRAAGIDCIGKEVIPEYGELTPDRLRAAIFGKDLKHYHDMDSQDALPRPPSLCVGCPHRGVFYTLGKRKDLMIFSDIGCYSLGMGPPYNATDAMICMGASISGGHGVAKALEIKGEDAEPLHVVSLIGDSTFFHSGMTSLLDVVYNRSATTTFILDNRITGMTGHQENPGSGYDLMGNPSPTIDLEALVKALGIQHVRTIDPNNLSAVDEALDWGIQLGEPSVIIAKWPCALKKFTAEDREDFPDAFANKCYVDTDACIGCKKCLKSGCPALAFSTIVEKKSSIIQEACLGCRVCLQICPVDAIKMEETSHGE